MMNDKQKHIADLLHDMLKQNRSLLLDTASLLAAMKAAGISGSDGRALIGAFNMNIGDILMTTDGNSLQSVAEGKEALRAKFEAEHLQDARIDFLLDVLSYAMEWTSPEAEERKQRAKEEAEQAEKDRQAEEAIKKAQEEAEREAKLAAEQEAAEREKARQLEEAKNLAKEQRAQAEAERQARMAAEQEAAINAAEAKRAAEIAEQNRIDKEAAEAKLAAIQAQQAELAAAQAQQVEKVKQPAEPQQSSNTSNTVSSEDSNGCKSGCISCLVIIALVIIIIVGIVSCASDDSGSDSPVVSQQQETVVSKDKEEKAESQRKRDNPCFLGNIQIGDSRSEVIKLLGKENSREKNSGGLYEEYKYDDMTVVFDKNDEVAALVSSSNKPDTIKGIRQGDSRADVISAYGDSEHKFTKDGMTLYEYDAQSVNNKPCLVRFAVNDSNNKVAYISIRVFEEQKKAQTPKELAEEAAKTLFAFHNNITDRNYRAAYNCTSANWQSRVTYDGWAPGFKNTVSSKVSNVKFESAAADRVVLTYTLTATDNPGGTNVFTGKAVLIKENNGWKIDYIENRK